MNNDTINVWTASALNIRHLFKSENIEDILELIRIGKKLNRFYTNSCNGYNSEKNDRLATNWENKAKMIAKRMKAHIYFQGDPRGATIYIDKKPIPSNNYTSAVCLV